MGRYYSFNMWVPRERLFDALSTVARYDGTDQLAPFIWPDGRRLPAGKKRRENDSRDLIPFDGSLDYDSTPCLSFQFEADDALRNYDESQQAQQHPQGLINDPLPQQEGRYSIGCIFLYIDPKISEWEWLEGEEELVQIQFSTAGSSMSDLFTRSSSIPNWFVALAREIGAFSCVLDLEGPFTLLFLEGEELQITAEEIRHTTGPFDLRHLAQHPESESASNARMCGQFDLNSSAHDRIEVSLCLRDENSGVRAKALKAIAEVEEEAARPIIEAATHDTDWRVRAVAASLFGSYEIQGELQTLETMLADPHPEVRIAATQSLGQFQTSFDILQHVLLSTPSTPENLGFIKVARTTIARHLHAA